MSDDYKESIEGVCEQYKAGEEKRIEKLKIILPAFINKYAKKEGIDSVAYIGDLVKAPALIYDNPHYSKLLGLVSDEKIDGLTGLNSGLEGIFKEEDVDNSKALVLAQNKLIVSENNTTKNIIANLHRDIRGALCTMYSAQQAGTKTILGDNEIKAQSYIALVKKYAGKIALGALAFTALYLGVNHITSEDVKNKLDEGTTRIETKVNSQIAANATATADIKQQMDDLGIKIKVKKAILYELSETKKDNAELMSLVDE